MGLKFIFVVGLLLVGIGLWSWKDGSGLLESLNNIGTTTPAVSETVPEKPAEQKPAPKPAVPAGAGARTFEKGVYVTTVFFTDQGFVPSVVEAHHGEEIRFVNKTNAVMHIIADEKTSSLYYRSINQPNTVGKGGSYQLQLPELGVFNYKNLNGNHVGQILVK